MGGRGGRGPRAGVGREARGSRGAGELDGVGSRGAGELDGVGSRGAGELDRVGAADENSRQFFRELVTTGSHQESVRCVAEGRADVAAIDCVTFALLRAHRPELLNGVAVFGRTPPLPGLPIIAASGSPHVAPLRRTTLATLRRRACCSGVSADTVHASQRTALGSSMVQ